MSRVVGVVVSGNDLGVGGGMVVALALGNVPNVTNLNLACE